MQLKFCKVRDVKSPCRANETDAGIDFFVPNDFAGVRLQHGESALIASGIKVDVPKGWMMLFENKSGVGSKKKLSRLACVIDHGYQGEVHINLVNTGLRPQIIEPGEKLIQGIMLPIGAHIPTESPIAEMWQDADQGRGTGGFGSTNK